MSARRWLALIAGVVVVAIAVTLYWLPDLVRHVATARVHALTRRPASIDRVDLNILTGRLTIHGLQVAERDGHTPFAGFERLDLRLRLPSLLFGHLWVRELILTRPTVHVVRLPGGGFNFSDLLQTSGTTGRPLDVTVDRFALTDGTVTLEDQALPERRTWSSEHIVIEAHNVSTRRDDGTAVGRSVTAGAPASITLKNLRLYPIHLQGTVTVEGLDLTPARVYLPPDASVSLARGRASTSLTVALDAREGLRADATARLEDVTLVRAAGGDVLAVVPKMTTDISGFVYREGYLQLGRLVLDSAMSARDPTAKQGGRFRLATVRATVADLTWPAATPGKVDVRASVVGGGTLAVTGALQPPPASTDVRVRLANVDLAPWAQFLPVAARITGLAEADLRMNEPLAAGIPARVQGSVAVNRLAVGDAHQSLLGAQRIEARGLEVHWPTHVVVQRLLISEPRGTVERARGGGFPIKDLARRPVSPTAAAPASAPPAATAALAVDIREIVVRNGALAWRDQAVSPAARLDVSSIDASVTGIGWPLRGPAGVRLALRPPGGGQLHVTGRVGFDPLSADLRLVAKNSELAPYQPYLPTTARVSGAADLDLAVVIPRLSESRATARGHAALSRVDVRDGERTVLRVERATATALEVDWPGRIAVARLALAQPWILVERDDKGALPLRALLTSRPDTRTDPGAAGNPGVVTASETTQTGGTALVATVNQVSVDGGGARVVDRAVSPAFAMDLQRVAIRLEGLSTAPAKPARVSLTGQLGPSATVGLRGTLRAMGGPLWVDVNGDVRGFAIPRANPYLLQQVGWKTTDGQLTSEFRCRLDGDALSARTDIRLSRLQVVRAAAEDGAQARIGLPLGLLTALLKDPRGDIKVSFPVGGRLNDPRFDFSEAIWSAVRTVAINAITLPVSWIGSVKVSEDSRIQRIDVNPVPFEPGTATLTSEGQAQATRLAAFLEELPEIRMTLTPVVSSGDVDELKRRALETTIAKMAREERLSEAAAARRLFEQRFRERLTPDTLEATTAALLEREPITASAVPELATRRLEAVRATLKQAGTDLARLTETKFVQREGTESHLELNVLQPESPQPSKIRQVLRRFGLPLKDEQD